MRRSLIAAAVALGLFAVTTYAQQATHSKRPNQTHDVGIDDDKAPAAETAQGPADRVVARVPVAITADGVGVAELDESFDEALVVTIDSDGKRIYSEVKGLDAAEAVVKAAPKPAPVLEEK